MKEIEIEYKIPLTSSEHQKIKEKIKFEYYVEQINYYFDTQDFLLDQNQVTLRVRNIEDRYYLMLKEAKGVVADETIVEISLTQFKYITQTGNLFDSEIKDIIVKRFGEVCFDNQATLKTSRYYTPYKECTLFLDESHYYGITDFELELEAPSIEIGSATIKEIKTYFNLNDGIITGKRKRAYMQKGTTA